MFVRGQFPRKTAILKAKIAVLEADSWTYRLPPRFLRFLFQLLAPQLVRHDLGIIDKARTLPSRPMPLWDQVVWWNIEPGCVPLR
jgi:hypothetical protein